jgi:Ser-tRNA(Ala) deacylase AlaX
MVQCTGVLSERGQVAAYLADTYLAEVSTRILAVGQHHDALWAAVECNLFHPQGGGQPADRGWLDEYEIATDRHPETGLVVATANRGSGLAALVEGQEVLARIDLQERLTNAALHTAGHLIEAAGRAQGWSLAGNNHFPGQARIEFSTPKPDPRLADAAGREEVVGSLRAAVAKAIQDDLPVSAETEADGRRIVHLGELHAAPCGGTHVRSLNDLADVTIPAIKVKKGRIRVSYGAAHGPRR